MKSKSAHESSVIVLCASDEEYTSAVKQLNEIGWPSQPVLIAGKPENSDELTKSGIHDFMHVGCDAVSLFNKLASALFIES